MNATVLPPSRLAFALDRPDDVLGRERRAVVPDDVLSHVHPDFALVVTPTPGREQSGLEREIWLLADVLIEDRAIDRLDGRIDRRRAGLGIEGRQVDVEGDVECAAGGRNGKALRRKQCCQKAAAGRERLTTRDVEHVGHSPLDRRGRDFVLDLSRCSALRPRNPRCKTNTLNLKQHPDKLTHWAFFRNFRHHFVELRRIHRITTGEGCGSTRLSHAAIRCAGRCKTN